MTVEYLTEQSRKGRQLIFDLDLQLFITLSSRVWNVLSY